MQIEVYSTKPLFGRRQWRWRARHDNGNIMATSGEGYNNIADLERALRTLRGTLPTAKRVDL